MRVQYTHTHTHTEFNRKITKKKPKRIQEPKVCVFKEKEKKTHAKQDTEKKKMKNEMK